ncbi:MFS transporter [Actinoplanes sp. NPDC023936]|uniref:MFS transporter n=1 Tax=Actinoplanes sp. NPDC023936 TaxID=3154910 RepID=UPI0033C371C4
MGRGFGWLWAAYAVSTLGTWLAFDAFPLIAILALDAGPARVSLLAAAGLAVGALTAIPLGPWVEFRRKRPVMVGADLVRFAAMVSVPVAYALDVLTFGQLLVVSMVAVTADITFRAASGAFLKWLVPRESLLEANARFETTTWTATVLGPPLGGAAVGLFGPVLTVAANAASFLVSALFLRGAGDREPPPDRPRRRISRADLATGWRHLLTDPRLRPLYLNTVLVNGLIMATAPLLAVLMLGTLGFPPWQYGLAFAVPCLGGLLGSSLARPLALRYGRTRVLRVAGALRACWSFPLALVTPGVAGLAIVMVAEFLLIVSASVFSPLMATERLDRTPQDRVARVLAAWTVTDRTVVAALTALWGLLAAAAGTRVAIGAAGLLLLATPIFLIGLNTSVPRPAADKNSRDSQFESRGR